MTVYRQDANPNATNSELDAKVIVKHPRLTHTQRDELIEQFVEIQVDSMDHQSLYELATEYRNGTPRVGTMLIVVNK